MGHHPRPMTTLPSKGIYAITDGRHHGLLEAVAEAIAGGVAVIQYRDLTDDSIRRHDEAQALATLCRRSGIPLIIDHDIALAKVVDAAGVHLSQADGDPRGVREALGSGAIVGVSCYASPELARAAAAAGASYVSFGAFFPSPTKPEAGRSPLDLLAQTKALGIPRVAIGGITSDNGGLLVDAGAEFLATVSAVFGSRAIRADAAQLASLYLPRSDQTP